MPVYRCQSRMLAAHASTLGEDGVRAELADAIAAVIWHETGQPTAVDPAALRCRRVPIEPTAVPAVLAYEVEYEVNEHDNRREAALAQLDGALAGAVLTADEERSVSRLREQDTATIEGVARLLWAARAAEAARPADRA
jgi:hypothetical protein